MCDLSHGDLELIEILDDSHCAFCYASIGYLVGRLIPANGVFSLAALATVSARHEGLD